jgi:Zn-dependent M32 family carboxypeptidase
MIGDIFSEINSTQSDQTDELEKQKEELEKQKELIEEQQEMYENIIDSIESVADYLEDIYGETSDAMKELNEQFNTEKLEQYKKEMSSYFDELTNLIQTTQNEIAEAEMDYYAKLFLYEHWGVGKEEVEKAKKVLEDLQKKLEALVKGQGKYSELINKILEDEIISAEELLEMEKAITDETSPELVEWLKEALETMLNMAEITNEELETQEEITDEMKEQINLLKESGQIDEENLDTIKELSKLYQSMGLSPSEIYEQFQNIETPNWALALAGGQTGNNIGSVNISLQGEFADISLQNAWTVVKRRLIGG